MYKTTKTLPKNINAKERAFVAKAIEKIYQIFVHFIAISYLIVLRITFFHLKFKIQNCQHAVIEGREELQGSHSSLCTR